MPDCIFCKIIAGNFPCMKVYEDEKTIAIMDVAKDVDGHILVIPKEHYKNILDCDYDILSAVISTTKKVSLHLIQDCSYDWVNLLNASDESAWQSVPHFHIHIIPRKQNDDIDAWPKFAWAKEDIKTVYERIKM